VEFPSTCLEGGYCGYFRAEPGRQFLIAALLVFLVPLKIFFLSMMIRLSSRSGLWKLKGDNVNTGAQHAASLPVKEGAVLTIHCNFIMQTEDRTLKILDLQVLVGQALQPAGRQFYSLFLNPEDRSACVKE
jgi:hypothetical protein